MRDFAGRTAVITGAASGIGRALARSLSSQGCHLAVCDVADDELAETKALCERISTAGTRVTAHHCDVSDENQVEDFRIDVARAHGTDRIDLLFNNAGIAGAGSFVVDAREDWEKVFAVNWWGVYHGCRTFLPMLMASDEAWIVNTSSALSFWARGGRLAPSTAYSTAKFAIRGFSEALVTDLRLHAPHIGVSVVLPGHVGTNVLLRSAAVLGRDASAALADYSLLYRDNAPLTADEAAQIILDGVREGRWRILVGEDAIKLDELVREGPEDAYEPAFIERMRKLEIFRFVL